jgi:hypothetical protein
MTQRVRKMVAAIFLQMSRRWQRCPRCKRRTIVIDTKHPIGRLVAGYVRPIFFYRASCKRCGYESVADSEEKRLSTPNIELWQLPRCTCPCGCGRYFVLNDYPYYKEYLPDGSLVCRTCFVACCYQEIDVLPIDDQ